jgi:BirA family biotin operon repressor/biotin-[acetyl-CoA-carboxylase] ligase
MKPNDLKKALSKLPSGLGDVRYFDSIGSTNNEALAWAASGAKDLSLVIADEQTAGRGRLDRKWFTPRGAGLAFSLILRPTMEEKPHLTRTVGLAALAIAESLRTRGLGAQIKWPNDVLLNGCKIAGVLIETVWSGDEADCLVVGIGVNVRKEAVPSAELLQFPATSLEQWLGFAADRGKLLHDILAGIIALRPRLGTHEFIASWEKALAFRGEQVQVDIRAERSEPSGERSRSEAETHLTGKLLGLESDGSLKLSTEDGKSVTVRFGDVRLRPQA